MSREKYTLDIVRQDFYVVNKNGTWGTTPLVSLFPKGGGSYYSVANGITIEELNAAVKILNEWEGQNGQAIHGSMGHE